MAENTKISMIMSLVDRISGPIKKVVNSVSNVGEATDKVSRKFTRLRNEVDQFARQARRLDGIGKPLLAVGAVGAAGITATVAKYATLEEAQKRLKIQLMDSTGKVGEDYEKLTRLAERLGTELPGSTKDMVEMFTALREQGIQTKMILNGYGEAAAKFSVLMKVPFAEAATYVAKFAEAMGVADTDTEAFMDTLQRLKGAGGVEVEDLFESFKYMGASLKALRVQGVKAGEDVSAAIGLMAMSSIEGSTAGTSLAMALSRMAEVETRLGTGKVKKLIAPILDAKGIDLNFFDAKGDFVGIRGMIKELEKLRSLTSQEQLLVLTKLFGQEAARPLSVFVTKGVEGFDEMLDRMEKQASMQQKIDEIMSGTKKKWGTLSGTLENLVSNIGGMFAELVDLPGILEKINGIVGKMNDWVLANPKTAGAIGGVIVSLTTFALIGGGVLMTISAIGAAIGPFLGGFAALAKVIGIVTTAFRVLSLAVLTNPIALAIAGIAFAAFLIYKNWGPITEFFKRIWKSVVDLAGKMREAGANLIKSLWEGIKSLAMKPVEAIKSIANKIRNNLPFSPAKEGPLRDINRIRIVETIADTIKPDPMVKAMRRATAATMMAVATIPGGAAIGGEAGATINYAPVINLAPGTSAEVRQQVDQALAKSQVDFERMFDQMMQQKQRRAY